MHLHFIESSGAWQKMLPLTYTRPIADLRIGILKISKKWMLRLGAPTDSYETEKYLQSLFASELEEETLEINSTVLPDNSLVRAVKNLSDNQGLYSGDLFIAGYGSKSEKIEYKDSITMVEHPWDIFRLTKQEIEADFDMLTAGRESQAISDPHTKLYGERIFIEEGVKIKATILNSETGAIYLGKNSEIQEGSVIRGSFSLGENSIVTMGAKLRGDTSVGPSCKIGGEISNSSIQGFSSKAHDGFLGNSVLGEWCNIGADSNNSNLKNNYTNVKMWDFESQRFKDTGLQFCGLIMADHSKCGINTMFNTGTTVGVSANIFGSGFPRNIVSSFAWGGANGFSTYQVKKALETARLAMARRGKELSDEEAQVLEKVFEITRDQRIWDK